MEVNIKARCFSTKNNLRDSLPAKGHETTSSDIKNNRYQCFNWQPQNKCQLPTSISSIMHLRLNGLWIGTNDIQTWTWDSQKISDMNCLQIDMKVMQNHSIKTKNSQDCSWLFQICFALLGLPEFLNSTNCQKESKWWCHTMSTCHCLREYSANYSPLILGQDSAASSLLRSISVNVWGMRSWMTQHT